MHYFLGTLTISGLALNNTKYAFACNKTLMTGIMDINPHGWRIRWAAYSYERHDYTALVLNASAHAPAHTAL